MKETPLVSLRLLRGFNSRGAVAIAAELSEPTVWKIETTDRAVRPESLAAYARALRVPEAGVGALRVLRGEAGDAALAEILKEGPQPCQISPSTSTST